MAQAKDRVTLGLTSEGAANLERVMESKWFGTEIAAYRAAIAVALASGTAKSSDEMKEMTTKFNQGSLDPDGSVRDLILLFADGDDRERPMAFAERLAEAGLADMAARLSNDPIGLAEALGLTSSPKE